MKKIRILMATITFTAQLMAVPPATYSDGRPRAALRLEARDHGVVPIVPLEEQIENSSLYFEPTNQTWFLFTNHVGINDQKQEFTDTIWMYWSNDLNQWDPKNKAVVLDGRNCSWSKSCIGMPSVIKVGQRLAVLYDAPGGDSVSHLNCDLDLAWLDLPLVPPSNE